MGIYIFQSFQRLVTFENLRRPLDNIFVFNLKFKTTIVAFSLMKNLMKLKFMIMVIEVNFEFLMEILNIHSMDTYVKVLRNKLVSKMANYV